jgi:tetratricopeptide (TPR) repeat protein
MNLRLWSGQEEEVVKTSLPDRHPATRLVASAFVFVVFASFGSTPRAVAQMQSTSKVQKGRCDPDKSFTSSSRQEFSDYNAAYAISGGSGSEKAADDFAAKYPTSELRSLLYSRAMTEYVKETNTPKMLSTGREVLALDRDNCLALVLTAEVLSDSLSNADQDGRQKIAEIKRSAGHALQLIDSGAFSPQGTPPAIEKHKTTLATTLAAIARAALGIMELKSGDNARAEENLRIATRLGEAEPNPYDWYHLALAQDRLKKYAEARASADQALRYAGTAPDLIALVEGERRRLAILARR